jgi:hypothetical protein
MDHAKFCPAAQGRSMLELLEPCALLRLRLQPKQEQDHGKAFSRNAIACPSRKPRPINRLMVKTGNSGGFRARR